MATISSPGSASGLDVNALVARIVAAERQPVAARLGAREGRFQAQLTAFGTLKSALSTFDSALGTLADLSAFQVRSAESARTDLFTATATSVAVPGTFSIEVTNLAAAHKLASAGFASAATDVGSGVMTIASGTSSFQLTVSPGAGTLAEIRDAINGAPSNPGVSATIINVDDGAGGTESRLVLTADATGTANAIRVTVNDDDGIDTDANGLSRLVFDPLPAGSGTQNLSEMRPAQDAVIKIDQQTVTASSNTIVDAIDGVTIELATADPGNPADLTVSFDKAGAAAVVKSFVSSYNNVRKTISNLSRFDADTSQAAILLGDATSRTISDRLRSVIGESVSGLGGPFSSLAEIGISTGADGTLSLDDAALDTAMSTSFDAVGQLFASSGGIAVRLGTVVGGFVDFNGVINARTDGLKARIDDIAAQREVLDRRLASLESRLRAQFNAMDAIVSGLQSSSDFLSQQFSALSSLRAGK